MHRVFGAQALKMGPQGIVGEQGRVGRVQLLKGHGIGVKMGVDLKGLKDLAV
jgi:hypothetical protein